MRIVILGGGMAGMLAAYALRKHKPVLLEGSAKLGGMFTAGGLKYIHDTPNMRALMNELGVAYKPANPVGALYMDGETYPHPGWLASLGQDRRRAVQQRHWEKTRRMAHGFRDDCMNDPLSGNGLALDCDHNELVNKLANWVSIECSVRVGSQVIKIDPTQVRVKEGIVENGWHYDMLVPTIPLPALARLAPWAKLPNAEASKLGIMQLFMPYRARPWDYMYTPGLRHVSRIVWPTNDLDFYKQQSVLYAEFPFHTLQNQNWQLESNQEMVDILAEANLAVNGPDMGDMILGDLKVIPGHLIPLVESPDWPEHWKPLGRFTEWDSRATADKVYERALQLANA